MLWELHSFDGNFACISRCSTIYGSMPPCYTNLGIKVSYISEKAAEEKSAASLHTIAGGLRYEIMRRKYERNCN